MCPFIELLGDINIVGVSPPTVIAASPDVFLDNKPVARLGDPLVQHDKPNNPCHQRNIAYGVVLSSSNESEQTG